MSQLNDAQSQLAALQAAQAAQDAEKRTLIDQASLLTKRVSEMQAGAAKDIEALKSKLADKESENARLRQEVAQWKAAADKESTAARTAASQRDQQTQDRIKLERRVEDLSAKNAELFRLGNEILDRYEKFGLGAQFLAREPFVGRARVELENQIQDFDDKLSAQLEDKP